MGLKIGFCGPNPELNDRLARHVKDLIGNEVVDVIMLPNPYQEVMEIVRNENFQNIDIDWVNLWIATYRRMVEVGAREGDLVLSTTCGLDQVVIQAAYLQSQVERGSHELLIADATGQTRTSAEMALLNRSGSVLQVLLNQAEEEMAEYWDFVYAVLPVALGVASTPDAILVQYEDFLTSVPVFSMIDRLPDNEEAAQDALSQEATKWKEKLKA